MKEFYLTIAFIAIVLGLIVYAFDLGPYIAVIAIASAIGFPLRWLMDQLDPSLQARKAAEAEAIRREQDARRCAEIDKASAEIERLLADYRRNRSKIVAVKNKYYQRA